MAKFGAYGAKFQVYITDEYKDAGAVQDIKGPGLNLDTIDVTTHDSSDGFKEYLAGLADGGEVTFTIVYDPGDAADTLAHYEMRGALSGRTQLDVRLVFNDDLVAPITTATTWQFDNVFITGFSPGQPVAGAVTADVTVKLTEIPDFNIYD